MQFIEYPKCSTCKKAKAYLEENHISFEDRSITEETPTKEELSSWIEKYHLEIDKLWNTSGIKYREINATKKIKELPFEEKLELLSSDGMLIKRPLLVGEEKIIIGIKEKEYEELRKK